VFSSEDWTGLVYDAAKAETPLGQTAVIVIFFAGWLMFAYFIVMQMFIAVINENFQVAEEQKKSKQASQYWATHRVESGKSTWIRRLNPYRWVRANPVKVKVENLPSNLVLPMQKALVQDYAGPSGSDGGVNTDETTSGSSRRGMRHYTNKSLGTLQKLFAGDSQADDFPLQTIKHTRSETLSEEMERHLELLASVNPETSNKADMDDAIHERKAQKADFIRDHPTYDKTFWVFSQKNPIRRLCQKVVAPANGPRIFGTPHTPSAHVVFQIIIFLAVIGGIVTESIATPMYRRNFFAENGFSRSAWFDTAETAFGLTLLRGILYQNRCPMSIWNVIDFFILVGF
ncbi:hypothetical protein MPER_03881, partial [Moniliophthora perniciosa FA553]